MFWLFNPEVLLTWLRNTLNAQRNWHLMMFPLSEGSLTSNNQRNSQMCFGSVFWVILPNPAFDVPLPCFVVISHRNLPLIFNTKLLKTTVCWCSFTRGESESYFLKSVFKFFWVLKFSLVLPFYLSINLDGTVVNDQFVMNLLQ